MKALYFGPLNMENKPIADCLRRASLASAISVTRPGAAASIPTKEEVEKELVSKNPRMNCNI